MAAAARQSLGGRSAGLRGRSIQSQGRGGRHCDGHGHAGSNDNRNIEIGPAGARLADPASRERLSLHILTGLVRRRRISFAAPAARGPAERPPRLHVRTADRLPRRFPRGRRDARGRRRASARYGGRALRGSKRMNVSRPNRVFRESLAHSRAVLTAPGSFAAPTARCPSGLSSLEARKRCRYHTHNSEKKAESVSAYRG